MAKTIRFAVFLFAFALLGACGQHYVTPGGSASMAEIAGYSGFAGAGGHVDGDISKHFKTRPAASFPANIAVIRVQDSGYRTPTAHGYGHGRYTIVTTRDIESDAAYERMEKLSDVQGVAPIGRMLVPVNANTIRDLRIPAAKLHADMVLVYSVDTSFYVDGKERGPLSLISLGLLPNMKAHVTATVAGMLVDVRTGHIYGTTEATDIQEQRASMWSTEVAIESARKKAEKNAFEGFVGEFEQMWPGVVSDYKGKALARRGDDAQRDRHYTIQLRKE